MRITLKNLNKEPNILKWLIQIYHLHDTIQLPDDTQNYCSSHSISIESTSIIVVG